MKLIRFRGILRRRYLFWVVVFSFSLFKLLLLSGQGLFAIGHAPHDDGLFVKLASNLVRLHWLGDYDNLTLAKGMGYPLWIAITYFLGIPLLSSEHLLYILGCVFLIIALRPFFKKNNFWLLIIYLVVLFNPASFSSQSLRVLREGIYVPLSLLIISLSIGIFARIDEAIRKIVPWILGLGFVFSYFWITREEGVWILPFLILMLLSMAFCVLRSRKKDWVRKILLLFLPFIMLFLSLFLVSTVNYFKYGIFNTVEYKNHTFLEAYGSLTRVKDEEWNQFVPVSREKMKKISEVSPAFKEIEPYLEGDIGKGWAKFSSLEKNRINGEMEGGWFMWAFRDAVSAAGYYKTGKDALGFYNRLSSEIDGACNQGQLDCFKKRASMTVPFYKDQIKPLFNSFIETSRYLLSFSGTTVGNTNSIGSDESLELFSKITREPVYKSGEENKDFVLQGWIFSPYEDVKLSVLDKNGKTSGFNLTVSDSEDVYNYFLTLNKKYNFAKRSRFKIVTDCFDHCSLLITGGRYVNKSIPMDGTVMSDGGNGSNLYFYFDNLGFIDPVNVEFPIQKLNDFKVATLNSIAWLYQQLMLYFTLMSLLVFVISFFFKKIRSTPLFWINLAILSSVVARVLIISIISATSFGATNIIYLSSAHSLLLIFVLLNLFSILSVLRKKKL